MMDLNRTTVAVIGAGPAGLTAAKHLLEAGFRPVLFEQSSSIGGQWNATAPHSGVWKGMRTNTSHVTTCFSDLPHPPGTQMFPTNREILAYLLSYAERFGLKEHIRLNTRVKSVAQASDGKWRVCSTTNGQPELTETFGRVVVASGRFNKPRTPKIKGLETFKGAGGVRHAFDYEGPEPFREQSVLVVGNSISALEISADLASGGAGVVYSACRKPRYILSKILAGVPTDMVAFTRFGSLAGRALPPAAAGEGLKQMVLRYCGNPAQYGGLKPSENIFEASISQCQHYLPLVAEGKIRPRLGPREFTDSSVTFADGSRETIDAVILGTGYDLHLPFLDPGLCEKLNIDHDGLDLYQHTFHPDLEGLAFVGLYVQHGPYFPVVELQARWVAMTWGGALQMPAREAMLAALTVAREERKVRPEVAFHDMTLLFAGEAGVAPDIASRPHLAKALIFGPLAPVQFRMDGHGNLPGAEHSFAEAAAAFGCVTSPELDAQQRADLEMLAGALKDESWLPALLEKSQGTPD